MKETSNHPSLADRDPERYEPYIVSAVVLQLVILTGGTLLLLPGFVNDLILIFDNDVGEVVGYVSDNRELAISLILFYIAFVILHEGIHYATHRLNGFTPKPGIKRVWFLIIPNVVVLDELIPRNENVIGLISPVVILTLFGILGLLPQFPETVNLFAKFFLVVHTAESTNDIINTIRVARYPPGTQFRNVSDGDDVKTFVYQNT